MLKEHPLSRFPILPMLFFMVDCFEFKILGLASLPVLAHLVCWDDNVFCSRSYELPDSILKFY